MAASDAYFRLTETDSFGDVTFVRNPQAPADAVSILTFEHVLRVDLATVGKDSFNVADVLRKADISQWPPAARLLALVDADSTVRLNVGVAVPRA